MRIGPVGKFLLLLLPFFVLASHRVGSQKLFGYHHYRQAHTAMVARTFATEEVNILRPAIDGVSYEKTVYLNEFPLYPYIVGMIWRVTGQYLAIARLLSIAFAVGALWYFKRIVERFISDRALTTLAVFVMSITPVIAYFSKTVQRQSLFLFLLLLGLHYTLQYLERGRLRSCVAGSLGLCGAVLLNPYVVYIALPIAWYGWRRDGARVLIRWPVYLTAAIAVVPAAIWYYHALIGTGAPVSEAMVAISAPQNQRNIFDLTRYSSWFVPEYWATVYRTLSVFILPGLLGVVLFIYGVFGAPRKEYGFFRVWLGAVVFYFLMDFYPIGIVSHEYYWVNIAPLTAVFVSHALVRLWRVFSGKVDWSGRRAGNGWRFQAFVPSDSPLALAAATLGVVAAAVFILGAQVHTRKLNDFVRHQEYYNYRTALLETVRPGERLTVVADIVCPQLSHAFSPWIEHRHVNYDEARFGELLAAGDFEYLAVVYDTPDFPIDDLLSRIDNAGYLGSLVMVADREDRWRTPTIYLFRNNRTDRQGVDRGERAPT